MEERKQIVRLFYPCALCTNNVFNVERIIVAHMIHVHGRIIPPKPAGTQRPLNDGYEFQQEDQFAETFDLKLFGCPSCWFTCEIEDMEALRAHVLQSHPFEEEATNKKETSFDDEQEDNSAAGVREENAISTVGEEKEKVNNQSGEEDRNLFLAYCIAELDDINQYFKRTVS